MLKDFNINLKLILTYDVKKKVKSLEETNTVVLFAILCHIVTISDY